MKPPPTYDIPFPANIVTNEILEIRRNMEDEMKIVNIFYTDGSCVPNIGPGGSAYFSPNFVSRAKMQPIDHDTTINYCELIAIKMVIQSINRWFEYCKRQKLNSKCKYINIYMRNIKLDNYIHNIWLLSTKVDDRQCRTRSEGSCLVLLCLHLN